MKGHRRISSPKLRPASSRVAGPGLAARLAAVLLLWAAAAAGADFSQLKPQGYVTDYAGVVDPASERQLERFCARLEAATGAQIAFVILPDLDGEPVEDVANLLYRRWGIGKKETNEGLLFLLALRDRKSRLEVGYGLEPVIPDGYAGSLLREMRPALRRNNYGEALVVAAGRIGERIAQAKGVKLEEALPGPRRRENQPLPWPVMLGGVGLLLWLLSRRAGLGSHYGGGYLPAFLLGNLLGGSRYRSHGGGGFGGYDSWDSFGGFGGGDSGGGGASSDW